MLLYRQKNGCNKLQNKSTKFEPANLWFIIYVAELSGWPSRTWNNTLQIRRKEKKFEPSDWAKYPWISLRCQTPAQPRCWHLWQERHTSVGGGRLLIRLILWTGCPRLSGRSVSSFRCRRQQIRSLWLTCVECSTVHPGPKIQTKICVRTNVIIQR